MPNVITPTGVMNNQSQLNDLGGADLNNCCNLLFANNDATSRGNNMWPAASGEQGSTVPFTGGLLSAQLDRIAIAISKMALSRCAIQA